jgi:hypothetical protein
LQSLPADGAHARLEAQFLRASQHICNLDLAADAMADLLRLGGNATATQQNY